MTIPRVHALPGWASYENLTPAQATALDTNGVSALDKRLGQSDTLASNVTVSGIGSGITMGVTSLFSCATIAFFSNGIETNSITCSGDIATATLHASGNVTCSSSLIVAGAASCAALQVNSGGVFLCNSPATFANGLSLTGAGNIAAIQGITITNSGQTIAGATVVPTGSSILMQGTSISSDSGTTWTRSGPVVLSGASATTALRTLPDLPDADTNIDASLDVYYVPSITANRVYTLIGAPHVGTRVRLVMMFSTVAHTVTLINASSSGGAIVPANTAGFIEMIYRKIPSSLLTDWILYDWSSSVALI